MNELPHPPTHAEVLRWCDSANSLPWFPAEAAAAGQSTREQLYDATFDLLRLGFIEVADWQKGRGQGFRLTELGRSKLGKIVPPHETAIPHPPETTAGEVESERGKRVLAAFTDPDPGRLTQAIALGFALWFLIGYFVARAADVGSTYLLKGHTDTLLRIGAAFGPLIYAGDWWRLISSGFVHIGLIHLLLNLYGFLLVGRIAESLWGPWRLAIIFILSAVGGAMATTAFRPGVLLAGASGGIWGVMLSVVAGLILYRRHLRSDGFVEIARSLGLSIAVNAMVSFVPGIAWEAHFIGGAIGFLTAVLLDRIRTGEDRDRWIASVILGLLVAIGWASYRWHVQHSAIWQPIRTWSDMQSTLRSIPPPDGQATGTKAAQVRLEPLVALKQLLKLQQDGMIAAIGSSQVRLDRIVKEAAALRHDSETALSLLRTASAQPPLIAYYEALVEAAIRLESVAQDPPSARAWAALDGPIAKVRELSQAIDWGTPSVP